jgi:uncharacterized RmlC-like cupin family protein
MKKGCSATLCRIEGAKLLPHPILFLHLKAINPHPKLIMVLSNPEPDWPRQSLRIVRAGELNQNTPQTPGMTRAEAISHAAAGAKKLWAGTVVVHPNAKTRPHHHGDLETVIYIVRGRARFRWGNHLEFVDEAGPGDFVYVPPYLPHQELNARKDQPVEAVIVRSGQEPIVVNLDIPSPEEDAGSTGTQDDPFHSAPKTG